MCGGGHRGPMLVLFLSYVYVSGMHLRSRFSSQPLKIPVPWAPPGCYLYLIPLFPLLTCVWALRGWMSVTLFLGLSAVSVARFLAIRVGSVAVKRRVPIVVNYEPCHNPASCVSCGGPHPSDFPFLHFLSL